MVTIVTLFLKRVNLARDYSYKRDDEDDEDDENGWIKIKMMQMKDERD